MNMRRFVSIMLLITFIASTISGIALFLTPKGAKSTYTFLGVPRYVWNNIHVVTSFLGVIVGLIHIYLNWRALVSYFKLR